MQTPYIWTMDAKFTADAGRARACGITGRELAVLCLAAKGLSGQETGRRLGISDRTVRVHLSKVSRKLETANRTQTVLRARELGIIRPA